MMLTASAVSADQIRAARALLHLEQTELARQAAVSVVTIRRLEASSTGRVSASTIEGVRRALERAGAEFIPGGVRRRTLPAAESSDLFDALHAISRESAQALRGHEALTEADLYDEDGLPA